MNRRVLVGGALVVVGGALLLVTTGALTVGAVILPLLLLILGVLLFWRAFLPDGRDSNAFSGTLLALTGGFWLLWESALPGVSAASVWPVFMTIVGIALIVYGIRKGEEYQFTLVTPGIAIVLLSVVFLLFSFDIIAVSLASVAARWWPVIVVGVGLMVLFHAPAVSKSDDTIESDLLPHDDREKSRGER